jgi:hypothetical protein
MVNKGYGLELKLQTFQPAELVNATLEIIRDTRYAERAKKASLIFHDRPETPAGRAASGIELVLRHGGQHLRSNALDMPHYQFIMLDMLLFVCVLLVLLMSCIKFAVRRIARMCCPRKQTKLKSQ